MKYSPAQSIEKPNRAGYGWLKALTLTERLPLSNLSQKVDLISTSETARRKLQRWQEQAPFNKETYFAERLAENSLDTEDLLYLLSEPAQVLAERLPQMPHWLQTLQAAYKSPCLQEWPSVLGLDKPENEKPAAFLEPLKPLILQTLAQLDAGIEKLRQQYNQLPFEHQKVVGLLFESLPKQLVSKISRTVALEVNVARLQGHLQGDTPEARFKDFMGQLCCEGKILELLEEYSVLARQLVVTLEHWAAFQLEFLSHLCADWLELCRNFSPATAPGELIEVKGGRGDNHRRGRSVLKLKFSSGLQLIYKPKSMAIDVHFQQLLGWLNERGANPPFRPLMVVDRGSYGWVEFVVADSCATEAEVARFYERQGAYLALLYALEATDFHQENLIASGEHPILVDLEALFHPRVKDWDLSEEEERTGAAQTLNYSVLRIGLLPQRIYSGEGSGSLDISGLNGRGGQLTLKPVAKWAEIGTDQMHIIRERQVMAGSDNLPRLDDREVNLLDYAENLKAGFERLYRLLVANRDELLRDILPGFANDEIRVILRNTQTYAKILHESFHPDLLRDGLDRQRFFDNLWAVVEQQPQMRRAIAAELADLEVGDIPMFTTTPASYHLYDSRGQELSEYLAEPGLTGVAKRLAQLGEADLEWQGWFIQASLATVVVNDAPQPRQPLKISGNLGPVAPVARQELLKAACAVGDRLAKMALVAGDKVGWVGLSVLKNETWMVGPAGLDMYSGTSGIVLLLAYLGAVTSEKRYTELAKAALPALREQTKLFTSQNNVQIGAFEGLGSLIYLYSHLGQLWNNPTLFAEANELVSLIPALVEKDKFLDIINGAAGSILSLLSLYRVMPSAATLAAAIQCGEFLLSQAQPMPTGGVGWLAYEGTALTGFSHGAAGIAYSLLELAAVSGEEKFRAGALNGLEYERSLFSIEHQNWPDLREKDKILYPASWCHGAAGIALGRLASKKHLNDSKLDEEISIALKTTVRQGFGRNHSLCHGDLGNLEPLLLATEELTEPLYQDQLNYVTLKVLENIEQEGWRCGNPLAVETPGLMAGLAGIGYGLLRLATPHSVPCVLRLAPPI